MKDIYQKDQSEIRQLISQLQGFEMNHWTVLRNQALIPLCENTIDDLHRLVDNLGEKEMTLSDSSNPELRDTYGKKDEQSDAIGNCKILKIFDSRQYIHNGFIFRSIFEKMERFIISMERFFLKQEEFTAKFLIKQEQEIQDEIEAFWKMINVVTYTMNGYMYGRRISLQQMYHQRRLLLHRRIAFSICWLDEKNTLIQDLLLVERINSFYQQQEDLQIKRQNEALKLRKHAKVPIKTPVIGARNGKFYDSSPRKREERENSVLQQLVGKVVLDHFL